MLLFIIFVLLNLIIMFLLFINLLVYFMGAYNREKNSAFECGFNKISSSRLPFSIQFFIICLLFLIFDIEITLLIPLILSFNNLNYFILLIILIIFLFILIIGTIFEWMDNSFNWMI